MFPRIYGLAARALPRPFRDAYGWQLEDTACRRMAAARGRGTGALVRVWGLEMLDLIRTILRERWASFSDGHLVATERGDRGRRRDRMGTMIQDVRYALRGLVKQPAFTIVALTTLGLGIGANTAIFSVVDAALFRPVPLEGGDRFAVLWEKSVSPSGSQRSWVSYPNYQDLLREQRSFETLAAYRAPRAILSGRGDPTAVPALHVTASIFELVGSTMAAGRPFTAAEDALGADRVAVISHGLWERRFGGEPGVIGSTTRIDGVVHTIVGVLPEGLTFPRHADVWLPASHDVAQDSRGMHRLIVVGRLDRGATPESASRDVAGVMAQLERAYPESNKEQSAWVERLSDAAVGNARSTLLVLLGAVGLVLLIVCANVANLMLARTSARSQEVAVRTAMGADRARILRLFLTEAVSLAVGGAVLAGVVAWGALTAMSSLAPPGAIPGGAAIQMDGRVFAVMGLITLMTIVLFGLAPAIGASRGDVAARLREGRQRRRGGSGGRLRGGLVVLETALAMMLVVTAALLTRSLLAVQSVDPGFEPEGLWEIPLSLPFAEYTSERWPEVASFYDEVTRTTRELPGVEAAASTYASPLDAGWTSGFWFEGRPEPASDNDWPSARYRPVTPGYFATARIPLVAGREFTGEDDARAPAVVIVNEALAREHFPGEDPVGKRIVKSTWWEGTPDGPWEIVGVAGDVRFMGRDRASQPALYFPHAQRPMTDMTLLVRTRRDIAELLPGVRDAVWALDPAIPVENVRGAGAGLSSATAARRFTTLLMGSFGAFALLLAAVGLFGVLSYWVSQRTHEIGVRVSLGARPGDVRGLVVRQGARLAVVGALLGVGGALASGRLTQSLLFGVGSSDPATLVVVSILLLAVALFASYVPASRATRVDPVQALQMD